MVGIVLVSHSKKLAQGVVELAREMGGNEINLIGVGGLDMAEDSLGTDAAMIRAAIEQVYSEDGVLVLMDLGSAIISAELAVEMLPNEIAEKVHLCDAPLVEGAAAAAVQARIGAQIEQVIQEARAGLAAKQAHLGMEIPEIISEESTSNNIGNQKESFFRIFIGHPMGLHARPAARLVELAGRFPNTEIRIQNLTTNQGPANAKSIIGVTSLGVLQGHEIKVTASGQDILPALNALQALIKTNFGNETK